MLGVFELQFVKIMTCFNGQRNFFFYFYPHYGLGSKYVQTQFNYYFVEQI